MISFPMRPQEELGAVMSTLFNGRGHRGPESEVTSAQL